VDQASRLTHLSFQERCAELEPPRLAVLLDFFVRHFIKMAECCHRYHAYQQKQVYLDQADRLSIILSEMARYKDDAKAYREKIYALRMRATTNAKTMTRSQNEPPPETPKRNLEPIYIGTLKDRFTRQAAEVLAPPKSERSSHQGGHAKPSAESHEETIHVEAVVHEVQFKDEKAEAKDDDQGSCDSRKPALEDQSDETVSSTVQKVISLTDSLDLSETTYI